jgi:hypothetical protein
MIIKKLKIVRLIYILFFAGIVGYLIYIVINSFNRLSKSSIEDLPSSYTISSEDSSLIARQYWPELHADEIYNSKVRTPVSFLSFGNNYEIIIYRIDLEKDKTLDDLILFENKSVATTDRYTYTTIKHNNFFNLSYLTGPVKPVDKIFLTLSGDSIRTITKNDSLISYHLLCRNFSIRYAGDAPKDIFFVGVEGLLAITKVVPLNISFLKRGKAVYLLLMAPHSSKKSVPADLLDKIIRGR